MAEHLAPTDNLTIQSLHGRLSNYWTSLNDIFNKGQTPVEPPRLITYKAQFGELDINKVKRTVQIYPPILASVDQVLMTNKIIRRDGFYPKGTCHRRTGSISINTLGANNDDNGDGFDSTMIEEVTHMMLEREGVKVSPQEIANLNYPYSQELGQLGYERFGEALANIIRRHFPQMELKVGLGEFFPPIAQCLLLRDRYRGGIFKPIHKINYIVNQDNGNKDERLCRHYVHRLVYYLPEIAAAILLDLYKGDARALLNANLDLINLTGPELWKKYCVPLLEKGKI